jgi:hypothetical protein
MSSTFFDLLKKIATLGPRAGEIYPKAILIWQLATQIWAIVQAAESTPGTLSVVAFDPEEQELLASIAGMIGGNTAFVDLSGLLALGSLFRSTTGKVFAALLAKMLEDFLEKQG